MLIKRVAIVGAGPAGLMAADVLSQYKNYEIHIFEQKPSAARKFLMAGKTGLNISHAEAFEQFIQRYDQVEWLKPWIQKWDAAWIQQWMKGLGVESYVGSSGRIFPVEMKAAPLLRAWLKHLLEQQIQFHYRHQVIDLKHQQLKMIDLKSNQINEQKFDAIILACGAVSWSRLGSDGAWQKWLSSSEIETFQPSNAGVVYPWSDYMQSVLGQPLKRVDAWVEPSVKTQGDIVITQYGLESGLIYKQGRSLRHLIHQSQPLVMYLDLLPDQSVQQLVQKLQPSKKQSTANIWRKAGLDTAKSSLLRELVDKALWSDPERLAQQIKHLKIELQGFRPIEEAISCAGGVKEQALMQDLQLKSLASVFCCGEMLDWDAPTGGYLLTACFATGRAAGEGVHQYLSESS
ncbi:TIGR03862 family flavoprotein [Acinetobacter nematophilus]|uniref:TIGR03862 family flavoprotein n=1 Tax=Acinetobacter nematophilus TaxID=2994642 RepID=A0A9X3IGA8_9GAMM|nr:TIGR03862 family flavoprotein [Acinetobacter nematophilus]MCX5467693.1 TIGR03862 family flavoprotein [Acinetobacter nematophilus]